jgi:hypothetical protein
MHPYGIEPSGAQQDLNFLNKDRQNGTRDAMITGAWQML